MIGINLSGAEFGGSGRYGYDYIYPSASDINFYAERGVEFVRLPVRWERLQPTVGGKLDQAEVGRLKDFLANAESAGVQVLVDLHNYGGYSGNKIGGKVVSVANFADFWTQLAGEIKDSPALAGYDLMNEPYGFPDWASWPRAAQAAVDAIRKLDMAHDIYIEGDQMATASNWAAANPYLDIKDPANKIVYEAHVYFDRWGSGTSFGTVAQEGVGLNIGAERIANFVAWLKERDARGFIGEFAVPNTDPAWLVVLDNFLQEMEKHGLTGTYWGGGPWWGSYPLAPLNPDGTPRPQMAVLEKYFGEFETLADEILDVAVVVPVGTDHTAADRVEHFSGEEGKGAVSYVKSTAAVDIDLARDVQHGGAAEGDTLTGIATVTGSAFADTLSGDAAANTLKGGAGDDLLIVTAGGDTLDGGEGNDTADYRFATTGITADLAQRIGGLGDTLASIENLTGSAFNDSLIGDAAANRLSGMGGNDKMRGGVGDDTLHGDAGNDHVLGGDGNDHIEGGEGDDELGGDAGDDRILGGAGNDTLGGNNGLNTLMGGTGNDRYYVEVGTDVIVENAGEGRDTAHSWVSYALSAEVEGIELMGSAAVDATGNDLGNSVVGNGANNVLRGLGGNDSMRGGGGKDTIYGGAGNDHVLAGDGDDHVEGGDGNDELGGDAGDDRILGGAGNDALGGNKGLNTLLGGTGDDHYYVEVGTDVIVENAGEGWDTAHSWVSYALSAGVESIELMGNAAVDATGNDLSNSVVGNGANNVLRGLGGNDTMRGGGGSDTIYGGVGNDRVLGGDGNDRVEGGDGDDEVGGDAGNDHLIAGAGNDHLGGNQGADTLEGGAGADTFWYDFVWESTSAAPDHITDFEVGVDKIEVSHIDANAQWGGNQSFTFLGTAEFSRKAGELRYQTVDGSAVVQADINGDGNADFSIVLDHVAQIKASDLHL